MADDKENNEMAGKLMGSKDAIGRSTSEAVAQVYEHSASRSLDGQLKDIAAGIPLTTPDSVLAMTEEVGCRLHTCCMAVVG